MARKKIKLRILLKQNAKKSIIEKRIDGLFKKAKELSTLRDVDIGIIIFSRDEYNAIVWPSPEAIEEGLMQFLNTLDLERMKKMVTHMNYLLDRIKIEDGRVRTSENVNNAKASEQVMHQIIEGKNLNDLDVTQLSNLFLFAADTLKLLEKRNKELDQQHQLLSPTVDPPLLHTLCHMGRTDRPGASSIVSRQLTNELADIKAGEDVGEDDDVLA